MKTVVASLQQIVLSLCGLAVAGALSTGLLVAQAPTTSLKARIQSEITSSQQTRLQGSLHPLARAESDAGRMPVTARLNGVSLYFNRSAAQQRDLEALLAAQQDPASPHYHQWLTPDQFAARFGMAQ